MASMLGDYNGMDWPVLLQKAQWSSLSLYILNVA